MVITLWGYGIIGNLFGEKFVRVTAIIGFILAIVSLGELSTICVIMMAPAIIRVAYATIKPMIVGFLF